MDFVTGLPVTMTKKDVVWVIVDRLTKCSHELFFAKASEIYVPRIVQLHGVPIFITLNGDPGFISRFWKSWQGVLGRWERYLPLAEFADNNSYQASIQVAPFEALYGRSCRTPLCWAELNEKKLVGPKFASETKDKVKLICERFKAATDRQELCVLPWKKVLIFGHKSKLSPRFIDPYEVVERFGPVAYRIKLPRELNKIHDVFLVSMLRRYHTCPSYVIAVDEVKGLPDLTYEEELVKIVVREVRVLRNKQIPLVKVLWRNPKTNEATWKIIEAMRK
ncbi:DNA/RNA polymerases superfamily protein [Gossypium australe]|uniref:DNA/RNA polymerases superfamily protein n=1 Tax=Gossypium australe TaxID=47621 RepID=A0A5B6V9I1_9ROSI|nr:DNA/RNA polymerases superfamily protein [Gossypium australe]